MPINAQNIYFAEAGRIEVREESLADPGPDQVQVKCLANGICMFDVSVFNGSEPHFLGGKAGHEGVGVVTKVGRDVGRLKEGDYVACSHWATVQNQDARVAKLTGRPRDPGSFLIEPVSCVVGALYSYDITPGDRVLVCGAGFMGLINIQGLAHYPLRDLIVSDVKETNLALARQYGATETINSGTPEGRARLAELQAEPFDLVVECAGVAATLEDAGKLTRPGGRLAIFAWHHAPRAVDLGNWHLRGLKVLNAAPSISADHNVDNMQRAVWLLERGVFDLSSMLTHRHQFSDAKAALELAAARPPDYIKGVIEFSDGD